MSETLTLDSAHNFGVYTKSGKRTILQIDFSCKRVNLIERGNIRKSFDFENVKTYDSEEDLHIVIRFHGTSKYIEFDADTAEDKYTICRLLGILLGEFQIEAQPEGADYQSENGLRPPKLSTKKQVIKEGVLDKKGNTKIPTWSRRRLQVCPGEFSYFKTGEDVALNLVQLWENATSVGPNGHNGFTVSVRDRNYQFRIPSSVANVEQERDKWIQAFLQASQRKRATYLLLEMSRNTPYSPYRNSYQGIQPTNFPSIDEEERMVYYNQSATKFSNSSSNSGDFDMTEEFQAINELDEVLKNVTKREERHRPAEKRKQFSLSVVEKTSPVLASPTKDRARPPGIVNIKTSFRSENNDYEQIPEPDYSPPLSPVDVKSSQFDQPQSQKPVLGEHQNSNAPENTRESEMYTKVIKVNEQLPQLQRRVSGEYTTNIKVAPGAVNVMPKMNEIPKLRKVDSITKSGENQVSPQTSPRDLDKEKGLPMKQIQENIENTYVNEMKEKNDLSPRSKTKPAPPIPPAPMDVPPLQGPISPAPPPLPPDFRVAKGKLKQVHWTRVPKPLVANSIWERPRDMTNRLNLKLLEEQFSLKERDVQPPPAVAPKTGKQLLIDNKRAQNLGIFMSGLKNEGTRRLIDALNSVKEDETFPAEKLTTIRRYQPTQDEIDMYKEYVNKRQELHPVDQFMLDLCEIPCLSIRIDVCLTLWDFPWQYEGTCQLVDQVHAACDELQNSQMLVLVLEYLLAIGNYMNRNWSDKNVTTGFQLSSLDKVLDMRGRDSGFTMTHFLVEQLRTSDPGLLQWTETVQMVKKCENVSVKAVAAESEVLKGDLTKVKKHLKTLRAKMTHASRQDNKFQQDAQNLTVEYEMKLEKLDRRCGELHNKYRKLLTKFGEPLYQRSDNLFSMIAVFSDKFKAAVKDIEIGMERKSSSSTT